MSDPVPAFPGAEGWGAESVGGRGGQIIEVTNLNDRGLGSLRECAGQSTPRICVFRVAGVINLARSIYIDDPFITIAGQTAPGGGITLVGGGLMISTNNVIVRHLRYRGGSNSFITIRPWNDAHDIIVDHCSASGGEDDIIDIYYNDAEFSDPDIRNITIQNCLIAEADPGHPTGFIAGGDSDLSTNPPTVGSSRVHQISVNRNYFAHNGWRNPLIKSTYTEVINNVVYNWSDRIGGAASSAEVDFINNYWKSGPMTSKRPLIYEWFDDSGREFPSSSIYIGGNIIPSLGVIDVTDPTTDNWPMFRTNEGRFGDQFEGKGVPVVNRRFTPLRPAPNPVTYIQRWRYSPPSSRMLARTGV